MLILSCKSNTPHGSCNCHLAHTTIGDNILYCHNCLVTEKYMNTASYTNFHNCNLREKPVHPKYARIKRIGMTQTNNCNPKMPTSTYNTVLMAHALTTSTMLLVEMGPCKVSITFITPYCKHHSHSDVFFKQ